MPNNPSKATTNTKENSEKRDPKKVLTFAELKANYPKDDPCDKDKYKNQCSIRVAVSLKKSGVSFETFKGATCGNLHPKAGHILRAKQLASWLNKRYLANFPVALNITGKDWKEKAKGKTGIIFLQTTG